MSTSRRGFTLLELLMALTLTAIVGTVAGSALMAARNTSERIAAHREQEGRRLQFTEALRDLLRHAPHASQHEHALLALGHDAGGATLTFLSRGLESPFGTGAIWLVDVHTDSTGLVMRAQIADSDVNAEAAPALEWRVPEARALQVQVAAAAGTQGIEWREDWPLARTRPALLMLAWSDQNGARRDVVASLSPLGTDAP
ncbi:MAG: prepilin-type N-terminal cleavage/methylation domain-containing protein [Gemmatimonadaceae bacterium]|nr:prepilin-type N-terminal cleavage/methylation domain-containing protein [Gemmatimonadaceae bacterium]